MPLRVHNTIMCCKRIGSSVWVRVPRRAPLAAHTYPLAQLKCVPLGVMRMLNAVVADLAIHQACHAFQLCSMHLCHATNT